MKLKHLQIPNICIFIWKVFDLSYIFEEILFRKGFEVIWMFEELFEGWINNINLIRRTNNNLALEFFNDLLYKNYEFANNLLFKLG